MWLIQDCKRSCSYQIPTVRRQVWVVPYVCEYLGCDDRWSESGGHVGVWYLGVVSERYEQLGLGSVSCKTLQGRHTRHVCSLHWNRTAGILQSVTHCDQIRSHREVNVSIIRSEAARHGVSGPGHVSTSSRWLAGACVIHIPRCRNQTWPQSETWELHQTIINRLLSTQTTPFLHSRRWAPDSCLHLFPH